MCLRDIPSVSAVLDRIDWRSVQLPRQMVVETIRAQLASLRSSARNGRQLPTKKEITLKIVAEIDRLNRPVHLNRGEGIESLFTGAAV